MRNDMPAERLVKCKRRGIYVKWEICCCIGAIMG